MSNLQMKTFKELREINLSEKIEKKGGLPYLSWAHAVDTLMREDPSATWQFHQPIHYGQTMMVACSVSAFGKTMNMHLPVMDNRNNAIQNPDARKISDAMMRCLVKCIACFGIGLYIYAGEDLPDDTEPESDVTRNHNPTHYTIDFGKWNKRTIEQVFNEEGQAALENYVVYLEEQAAKKGTKIDGKVKIFIDEATSFINAFEAQVAHPQFEDFKV